MSAGIYNLTIEQGADFEKVFTWKISGTAVNLTGYSARLQIRHVAASTVVLAAFSSDPAIGQGTITLGGVAGTITLTMTAVQTAAITVGKHVYDLELVAPAGTVTRFLQGTCEVTAEVTR